MSLESVDLANEAEVFGPLHVLKHVVLTYHHSARATDKLVGGLCPWVYHGEVRHYTLLHRQSLRGIFEIRRILVDLVNLGVTGSDVYSAGYSLVGIDFLVYDALRIFRVEPGGGPGRFDISSFKMVRTRLAEWALKKGGQR